MALLAGFCTHASAPLTVNAFTEHVCVQPRTVHRQIPFRPFLQRRYCSSRFYTTQRCPSLQQRAFPVATVGAEQVDWIIADVDIRGLDNPSKEFQEVKAQIENDAVRLLQVVLNDKPAELSVVLCSDDFIRGLNSEHRHKECATDTLSFPQGDEVMLGDVVISLERAREQAKERGYELIDEVRVLLVHSLLHLLGYDHDRNMAAFIDMSRREEKLLSELQWKGKGLCTAMT